MSKIIRDKDELKKKINIVEYIGRYVNLQPKGNSFVGPSPVRVEKTPSFYVLPEKGIWKDFSGGADGMSKKGGDVFEFYRYAIDPKASFTEAVRKVAEACGYTYAQTEAQKEKFELKGRLSKLMDEYQKLLVSNLENNTQMKNYLKNRGMTDESIKRHDLGLSTLRDLDTLKKKGYTDEDFKKLSLVNKAGYPMFGTRITIPVKNDYGHVISFVGRATRESEEIKYLNGIKNEMYERGKNVFSPTVYGKEQEFGTLVEGTFDAIALAEKGFPAYAFLGTEATKEQLDIVASKHQNVLLMLDGDEAGQKAMIKLGKEMLSRGSMVSVAIIPDGKDPADYFMKENNEVFTFLKNGNAKDIFDKMLENQDFETLPGKRAAAERIEPLLEACDMLAKDWYSKKFAEKSEVAEKDARKLFPKVFGEGELAVDEALFLLDVEEKIETKYESPNDPVLVAEEELVRMSLRHRFTKDILSNLSEPFYQEICNKVARNIQEQAGIGTGMNKKEMDFLAGQKEYKPKYSSPEECIKEHRLLVVKKQLDTYKKAIVSLEKELTALEKSNIHAR